MFEIRPSTTADANAISALILSVAHLITLRHDAFGVESFLKNQEPEAIAQLINNRDFLYFVGHIKEELIGMVAMKNQSHLYNLYVTPAFHQQGFAKKLWSHAQKVVLQQNELTQFTVNSSPYALPVYKRFGFHATSEPVESNGIAYVPMVLNIRNGF